MNKRTEFAKQFLSRGYIYLVLALLYVPIVILLIMSFSMSQTFAKWTGFSVQPYLNIFVGKNSDALQTAVTNTLIIAIVSSLIATFMGTLAAIGIFYMRRIPKRIVNSLNQLPIINAEIVTAVSFMLFFALIPFIKPGFTPLIIGHVSFCTPYVVLAVMPRLYQMDNNVYEAALDLGATPMQAFWKVLFPMLIPGAIAGFVMSFTISLDDFIITYFNNGTVKTLSTFIWNDNLRKGIDPATRAMATVFFVVMLVVLLVINKRAEKSARHVAAAKAKLKAKA